jgi:CO dehydrogenase maturation factor
MVVVNRIKEGQAQALDDALKAYNLHLAGLVPEDEEVQEFDLQGRATVELGPENEAMKAAYGIFEEIVPE